MYLVMRFGWRGVIAAAAAFGIAAPAGAATAPIPAGPSLSEYAVSTAAVPMSLGDLRAPSSTAATTANGTHVAYTEAATETGSRSRAMASPVWSVSPNSGAIQSLGVPGAESLVAVRARHPDGPNRAGTHVPGGPAVSASANGANAIASAAASMATVAGFAVAEELAGTSQSSKDDDDGAVGRGLATVGKVQILGGLISMEGVITRVKVVSNGTRAVVEGNTTVNKVVIAGIPTSLTAYGSPALPEPLKTGLADMGLTVSLIEPADTIEGAGGSRSVGGVLVRYDSKIGRMFLEERTLDNRLLNLLPDRGAQLTAALLGFQRDVTLRLGQVAVQAVATPAGAAPVGDVGGEGEVLGRVTASSPEDVVDGPTFVTVDGDEVAAAGQPRFMKVAGGVGIPIVLVGLALLTALALALPLSRLVEEAVAPAVVPRRR